MITLSEVKLWLKIDFEDDDETLTGLINSSKAIIKSATGVPGDFIKTTDSQEMKDLYQELKDLYLMVQRVIINDLYNMRDTENKSLISLYTQLEVTYKGVISLEQ